MSRQNLLAALVATLTFAACATTQPSPQVVPTVAASGVAATTAATQSPVSTTTETAAASPSPTPTASVQAVNGYPAGFVPAREAKSHVGKVANVCGTVATADYAKTSSGSPTFLNLGKPYPKQVFTIVIWKEHRASFGGSPETRFAGARVCIKGRIESYNGIPEIISGGGDIKIFQ